MKSLTTKRAACLALWSGLGLSTVAHSQAVEESPALDQRVRDFLGKRRAEWRDMNVPEADGQTLHDLVIKNAYREALEIGTSTGRSTIWIAWALAKTGGRLLTIEIDEDRHRQARANIESAGLSARVDARLADAHELVPKLAGRFDFVFCDADKDWYKNYLVAVLPKLKVGGCFTAHNVPVDRKGRRGHRGELGEFVDYLFSLKNLDTTLDRSGAGLSISYKRSE